MLIMLKKILKNIFSYSLSLDRNHVNLRILGLKVSYRKKYNKKMKLGVAYNLFDGEELLEASLKSIRQCADFICVVYQKKSYYGADANPELENLLNDLKNRGLVDEIYLYERDFLLSENKHAFEIEKRNIGLKLCKKAGMTYYLSMDVDEFYDSSQINNIKDFVIKHNINSSACTIYEYLKTPEYRFIDSYTYTIENPYNFYVPFIMKIHKSKEQCHGLDFQTYADPTRSLNGNEKFYLFPVQQVVMHHMCTIRKDLDKKYNNSSYNDSGDVTINKINKIKQSVLDWVPEENRIGDSNYYLFGGKILEKVANKFSIKIEE